MIRADLYIGTGGTTTWERALVNLPSLVITDGVNQELFNYFLEKDKKIHIIGKSEKVKIIKLARMISAIMNIKKKILF